MNASGFLLFIHGFNNRQFKSECRTFAKFALREYAAALMILDYSLNNKETQAGAVRVHVSGVLAALELLSYSLPKSSGGTSIPVS